MNESLTVYVLDTSAWLTLIEDESGADTVQELLEAAQADEAILLTSFMSYMEGNCSASCSETGFFSCGHGFHLRTTFHGAMILVCETKTRFLMPSLSSYHGSILHHVARTRCE